MREGMAHGKMEYNYLTKAANISADNDAAQFKAKGQMIAAANAIPPEQAQPSQAGMWAGIAGDTIKGGLKIGDAFGAFDKKAKDTPTTKVDAKTGRSIDSEIAEWSNYERWLGTPKGSEPDSTRRMNQCALRAAVTLSCPSKRKGSVMALLCPIVQPQMAQNAARQRL